MTFLLLLGFTKAFVSPEYTLVGIVDRGRAAALDAIGTKPLNNPRADHPGTGDLALHHAAPGLSFGSSQALLRFDFKQNLRLWPVLAAGVQRSPPPPLLFSI